MNRLSLKAAIKVKRYSSWRGERGEVVDNVLQRNFKATRPNEKWVTDVTEFAVNGRKLYLSPIIDLFNNEVISHSISERPAMPMIDEMLIKPWQNWMSRVHPYFIPIKAGSTGTAGINTSSEQTVLCKACRVRATALIMPFAECFFGTLKSECFYLNTFNDIDELKVAVTNYIDYYNNRRISLKLKGLSPVEYRLKAFPYPLRI
jgi:putative transposase